MAAKQRSDLEFEAVYSCHLEKMMATLLGRVDRLCSASQLFMGMAIVSNLFPTMFGIVIAAIAVVQIVWQPGIKSAEAKSSYDRWHTLYRNFKKLTDDEIDEEIHKLSDRDSQALSSLCLAAHMSAATQLNLPISKERTMNKWQKFIAFCAGANTITP